MPSARSRTLTALTLTAALGVAGCGDSEPGDAAPAASTAASTAATQEAARPFNAVDVRFTQGMLPHHMQAVRNTEVVLDEGGGPEVEALARRILDAQREEIDTMQGFLQTFGAQEKPPPADQQAVWDKNTAELRAAPTAAERDVIFLTNMVPHHSAAVPMAQLDITMGKFPAAQALAAQIKSTQRREIAEMNRLIRART